ncbi:aminoglycoside phosphotransferase family protein [Patescibacteria group bacterium]|nr:aminoglycoside phosphotransferase family protein [Patescibacteria group bacterium]MBU1922261.1 aminoglycoside phosphotransferase family protein [Patescibacteria group bacterium]
MIQKIKHAIKFYRKKLNLDNTEDQTVEVDTLGNGENHLIYLAVIGNKKLVFRISFRKELEDALKNEFNILKKLPQGLGPKPFVFDDSKKIIPNSFMIQSFIPGEKINAWTKGLLATHAEQLVLLHSKNISEKKENLGDIFIRRADFTKNNQAEVIKDDQLIEDIFAKLNSIFSKNKQIFEKQEHSYLIHADLHGDNILAEKNRLLHFPPFFRHEITNLMRHFPTFENILVPAFGHLAMNAI